MYAKKLTMLKSVPLPIWYLYRVNDLYLLMDATDLLNWYHDSSCEKWASMLKKNSWPYRLFNNFSFPCVKRIITGVDCFPVICPSDYHRRLLNTHEPNDFHTLVNIVQNRSRQKI